MSGKEIDQLGWSQSFQQGPAIGFLLVCSQMLVMPAVLTGGSLSPDDTCWCFLMEHVDGHQLLDWYTLA